MNYKILISFFLLLQLLNLIDCGNVSNIIINIDGNKEPPVKIDKITFKKGKNLISKYFINFSFFI